MLYMGEAMVRGGVTSPKASIPQRRAVRFAQGDLGRASITGAWRHGLFSLFSGVGLSPEHPNTDMLLALLTTTGGVR